MTSHVDSSATAPRILTVGLPKDATTGLRAALTGVSPKDTENSEGLLAELASQDSALCLISHLLGGIQGIDLVRKVRGQHADMPVLFVLDRRLDSVLGRQLIAQLGVHGPLLYPISAETLAATIRDILGLPQIPVVQTPVDTTEPIHEDTEPVREVADVAPAQVENSEDVAPAWPSRERGDQHAEWEQSLDGDRDGPDPPFLLLVDDATDVSERIVQEAITRGMRVEATNSVLDARLMLARERPDAVLLDITLCNSTDEGLTLLEELDAHALPVPVLFLAERDSFIDRVQAVSLGGRGFLPKSVSPSDILKAVTRLLQQLHATESRVLAVDDDPLVLEDLRALLEPKGIKLTTLSDPLRFWTTLENSVPDLLMVDFDLPRWSGLELCKVVRNDSRWSALPVLCLTGNSDSDTVQRVFDAGADDFVSKPIVGPELVTKVVNRLQRIQLYRIMAEIDPLTGVANRLRATETLDHLLRLAKRQNQPLSLAFLDLDNFKQINDRFGHGTGDEALRRTGRLLARTFRTEDVVARLGGEEFIVGMYGMPRIGGVQRLTTLLESLREETPARMRGDGVTLTFSAGVAQYPEDAKDLDALINAADAALYHAKQTGKNRVVPAGWQGEPSANGNLRTADVVVVAGQQHGAEMMRAVGDQGYRVEWIKDGETATLRLGSADPTIEAAVVLLDLAVPILHGGEVVRRLARDGVLDRSRVIVLGEPSTNAVARKALELGAFSHMQWPVSPASLQQRVRQAIEVP